MQIEQVASHLMQSPRLFQYLVVGQDGTNLLYVISLINIFQFNLIKLKNTAL